MPLYKISITRKRSIDTGLEDETYVVASTRTNALAAFELPLTPQQRNRIESLAIDEVAGTVLTGA